MHAYLCASIHSFIPCMQVWTTWLQTPEYFARTPVSQWVADALPHLLRRPAALHSSRASPLSHVSPGQAHVRYRVADVVMQMLERDASEGGDARSGPLIDSRVCHERLLPAMAEVYVIYNYVHLYVCVYLWGDLMKTSGDLGETSGDLGETSRRPHLRETSGDLRRPMYVHVHLYV